MVFTFPTTFKKKFIPREWMVLRDMTKGLNKHINNPAQGAEEVYDTSSGACISARKKNISTDHNNNSTRDGELCDTHTMNQHHPITRINLE